VSGAYYVIPSIDSIAGLADPALID